MKFLVMILALSAFSAQANDAIEHCSRMSNFDGNKLEIYNNDLFIDSQLQATSTLYSSLERLTKESFKYSNLHSDVDNLSLAIDVRSNVKLGFWATDKSRLEQHKVLEYIRCLHRELGK